MREHESWCAARYHHQNEPPGACDCGAERENAQQLSTFSPVKRGKRKPTQWAGKLPAQFCVASEGTDLKRVELLVTPKEGAPFVRTFAACLECHWVREISAE